MVLTLLDKLYQIKMHPVQQQFQISPQNHTIVFTTLSALCCYNHYRKSQFIWLHYSAVHVTSKTNISLTIIVIGIWNMARLMAEGMMIQRYRFCVDIQNICDAPRKHFSLDRHIWQSVVSRRFTPPLTVDFFHLKLFSYHIARSTSDNCGEITHSCRQWIGLHGTKIALDERNPQRVEE